MFFVISSLVFLLFPIIYKIRFVKIPISEINSRSNGISCGISISYM